MTDIEFDKLVTQVVQALASRLQSSARSTQAGEPAAWKIDIYKLLSETHRQAHQERQRLVWPVLISAATIYVLAVVAVFSGKVSESMPGPIVICVIASFFLVAVTIFLVRNTQADVRNLAFAEWAEGRLILLVEGREEQLLQPILEELKPKLEDAPAGNVPAEVNVKLTLRKDVGTWEVRHYSYLFSQVVLFGCVATFATALLYDQAVSHVQPKESKSPTFTATQTTPPTVTPHH
jgi:hypothetical protein